ncbi:thioredoxin domain-containing protein [Nocardia sp. NEAU-G5]|uniref:Thioredoxin domain-containing protein n=1 Tax=Nocardia albiluteola TaxID=2842303 RepID=A0ABS6B1F5_9NOCA|nr:thioredoxin domain-containing protein [Nocardia albiluteola]MBU3063059.1 thioredoxin domain-containing protein [Nocardia albiluteola]
MNRLSSATSPYLRQHADNPVDWREWDAEALAEAAARDVPILLSVGYASCHWCHVMAHESFEDEAVAAVMNADFVCVKVDREERPDIDAIYMSATVAMTGQGGWPMTCFLTPAGEPFYCGTYYPRTPRGGMPSFTQLLAAVADTWRTRRADVDQAAEQVAAALREQYAGLPDSGQAVGPDLLDHAVAVVLRDVDPRHAGFGGAPKFPPSALLEGLLRHVERTGDDVARQAVVDTAVAMARGGIYDQLRGGFARYSVDAGWVVPHFEKMLYDNAQLLRVYAHLARSGSDDATAEPLPLRVMAETAQFIIDDLGTAEGGFASALDADTHIDPDGPGVEGATYVWTPEQFTEVLGPDDGAWAATVFGVTAEGNFEHGASVLTLPGAGLSGPPEPERFERVRNLLRQARAERPQPARDDKVVTAWNGMAITALAEAGAAHGRAEWVAAAARCARMLLSQHVIDGRLRRASLGGVAGAAPGVLEDYAWLSTGLLALHQATGDLDWLEHAQRLLDIAITHFDDPAAPGSWFDTAADAESLISRPRDPLDGATPSGASAFAEALLTASALSRPDPAIRYRELADATLSRSAVVLARAPRSGGHWLTVAEAAAAGPLQIAVSLPEDSVTDELVTAARRYAPGGAVVVAGPPNSAPLLADRPPVRGVAAAYVCRGSVCDLPVTHATDLHAALGISATRD